MLSRVYSSGEARPHSTRPRRPSPKPSKRRESASVQQRPASAVVFSSTASFFHHVDDAMATPRLPPSVCGRFSVGDQSLVLAPPRRLRRKEEENPPQENRATQRKAKHFSLSARRRSECDEEEPREKVALDCVMAERAARAAKERLKRLTAESVLRAKETFAANARKLADEYRTVRSLRPPEALAVPIDHFLSETTEAKPTPPPRRKPPIPIYRRRVEMVATKREARPEDNDEPEVNEKMVRVKLLDEKWIEVTSCVSRADLKAKVSLMSMDTSHPLLASEFRLVVVEPSSTATFAIELNSLGAEMRRVYSGGEVECAPAPAPSSENRKENVFRYDEEDKRRMILSRHVKTPAEASQNHKENLREAARVAQTMLKKELLKRRRKRHRREPQHFSAVAPHREEILRSVNFRRLRNPRLDEDGAPSLKFLERQFCPVPPRRPPSWAAKVLDSLDVGKIHNCYSNQ